MRVIRKALIAAFVLSLSFQFFMPSSAYGFDSKKVIIFIVDRVNLNDYLSNDLPTIRYLMENGTYGLMTVNSDGAKTPENVYMTLGCGTRAVGSEKAFLNFNASELVYGESAASVFKRNTGLKPQFYNIVNLDIAQIERNNLLRNHIVIPGAMGSLLENTGRKIAVLGNEGNTIEPKRYAPLIFMNEKGIVEFGDVSDSVLKRDVMSPFGVSTDYEFLYQKYLELKDKMDLIAFQLGDTLRANDYQRFAMDRINEKYRKKALREADSFIERVIKEGDSNTLYIVLTPLPPSKDMSLKSYLTPFILFGPGFTEGYAISDTTKRTGIVTNTDFMPTILKYLGIPIPAYVTGHPVYNSGVKGSPQELLRESEKLVFNYSSRPLFLKAYGIFQIGTFILIGFAAFLLKKYSHYSKYLLFFMSAMPLSFLLLPLFNCYTFMKAVFFLLVISVVLVFTLGKIVQYGYSFYFWISLATASVLMVDLATGQHLLKNSLLSYDVIAGARFYGIGNEYMGVLISATFCFTAFLFEKFSKKTALFLTFFIYGLVLFFIASPALGANVGGAITGFVAFGISILLLSDKRIDAKKISFIAVSILMLLAVLFYVDYLKPLSQQTHMGQTFALVKSHGFKALFQIFERKLLMNYKLIKYSIWSRVLLALSAILIFLFFAVREVFIEVLKEHPYVFKGGISTLVGVLMALAFNDSGVIAASTMSVFFGPLFLHLVIDKLKRG